MQIDQNKIKKINIESKYLNIASIVIFLVIVVVGYLISDSLAKQVNNKKYQADSKKIELEARLNNIEKFKNLRENVPDFPDKVEILDNIKNNQQSTEQLISQLDKIADIAGVKLSSISPDTANPISLQATLIISGNYASIKKFINGIENNQLILNISDIAISGQESNLSVTLTVKAGF